jgi:hypothetical protein
MGYALSKKKVSYTTQVVSLLTVDVESKGEPPRICLSIAEPLSHFSRRFL